MERSLERERYRVRARSKASSSHRVKSPVVADDARSVYSGMSKRRRHSTRPRTTTKLSRPRTSSRFNERVSSKTRPKVEDEPMSPKKPPDGDISELT